MESLANQVSKNLSPRERQALELKSKGLTRAGVARELGVGAKHVKNLWQSARRKARRLMTPQQKMHYCSTPARHSFRFRSLSAFRQV